MSSGAGTDRIERKTVAAGVCVQVRMMCGCLVGVMMRVLRQHFRSRYRFGGAELLGKWDEMADGLKVKLDVWETLEWSGNI